MSKRPAGLVLALVVAKDPHLMTQTGPQSRRAMIFLESPELILLLSSNYGLLEGVLAFYFGLYIGFQVGADRHRLGPLVVK